jgi:predicted nucleic acid-binding protein
MKIFLDTSCLFKLYYQEEGTDEVEKLFIENTITTIFLSEIAKLEFASTVWKKVRKREIKETQADIMVQLFEKDYAKYTFIIIDGIILEQAKNLIARYGAEGLRTSDSI